MAATDDLFAVDLGLTLWTVLVLVVILALLGALGLWGWRHHERRS